MASTPQETLIKYQGCTEGAKTGYSVFMSYVNLDYKKDPKDDLLGIIIPCGSYETKEAAESASVEISATTGCPTVVFWPNGKHYSFTDKPKKNALIYETEDKATLSQIRESIYAERRRLRELEKKIDQERVERDEPESMSKMINLVYNVVTSESRLAKAKQAVIDLQTHVDKSTEDLYSLSKARPDLYENWIPEAQERFDERGENEMMLFQQMKIGMEKHDKIIKSSLSSEKEKEE